MKFPLKSYQSVGEYFTDYRATMEEGLNSIDIKAFENIINLLDETIKKKEVFLPVGMVDLQQLQNTLLATL